MSAKMIIALVFADFALTTAVLSRCDPLTQYEESGKCCQMCSPGTSMSRLTSCFDPQCTECGENEYQDKYNTELKCHRQPYCDPNRNFQVSTQESKKQRLTCMCLLGFHCSSETCLTCIPHTNCKPGEEAVVVGNHTHDSVCQKCPEGSYSTDKSWKSVCIKQTECGAEYRIQQKGTATSDNVCERMSRKYIVLYAVLPVMVILIITAVVAYVVCVKRRRQSRLDINGGKYEELAINNGHIHTRNNVLENGTSLLETQCSQEECGTRTPEENIDEGSREDGSDSGVYTQNGNCLKQETGKAEIQPRQEESPTQTVLSEASILTHMRG